MTVGVAADGRAFDGLSLAKPMQAQGVLQPWVSAVFRYRASKRRGAAVVLLTPTGDGVWRVGVVDLEAVGEGEVGDGQWSSVGVLLHQGSGGEVADAGVDDPVPMDDIFAGDIELAADVVAAEATDGRGDGGGAGTAVDVIHGGRGLQPLLLNEEGEGLGGGQVEVDALLLDVLEAE